MSNADVSPKNPQELGRLLSLSLNPEVTKLQVSDNCVLRSWALILIIVHVSGKYMLIR